MGAIAGIYLKSTSDKNYSDSLSRMLEIMAHRGEFRHQKTGNEGYVAGLLHNNHPGSAEDVAYCQTDSVSLIMDGDIFFCDGIPEGDDALRAPARLVLSLYRTCGIDFVNRIDGTYTIGLYDAAAKRLFLVRDRLGTRPLFYCLAKAGCVFASEIKGILASGLYQKEVDLRGLNCFLSYGYTPNPDSMFTSVKQVKPGCVLMLQDGVLSEKRYWRFQYSTDETRYDDDYYIKKYQKVFRNAVNRRLELYPDAGAFLSGGLDSSGVSVVMHELKGSPHKVFSAGFHEKSYNEIDDAKVVSDALQLEHFTTLIDFMDNFPELLEKLVWHHDGPFSDTSAIPSYYAAKLARAHVDTVFTGDFPDQLIGGSGHQVFALARQMRDPLWKKILRNRPFNSLAQSIPFSAPGTSMVDKMRRTLYRETFSLEDQRIIMSMPIPPHLKRRLYSEELLAINEAHDPMTVAKRIYDEVADEGLLNKILYFDINSYAPDDLMVKVDRMCSAHGLNAISPFHDRQFVEFIATLPAGMKIRGERRKFIMREALRPLLPEATLNKKKQGFAMPIGEWLVRNLSDYVRDVLLDSRTLNRGYFNKRFMERKVGEFLAGRTDYASGSEMTIISLITLELWHRVFIDS